MAYPQIPKDSGASHRALCFFLQAYRFGNEAPGSVGCVPAAGRIFPGRQPDVLPPAAPAVRPAPRPSLKESVSDTL